MKPNQIQNHLNKQQEQMNVDYINQDVRFHAYLLAEKDKFSKSPDEYWFQAKRKLYE
jgi:hypothetical protein